eukprot:14709070-Heterocapsa_arctica.AAC.2
MPKVVNAGTHIVVVCPGYGAKEPKEEDYIIKEYIGLWVATEESRRGHTIPYGSTEAEGKGFHCDPTPLYSAQAEAFREYMGEKWMWKYAQQEIRRVAGSEAAELLRDPRSCYQSMPQTTTPSSRPSKSTCFEEGHVVHPPMQEVPPDATFV